MRSYYQSQNGKISAIDIIELYDLNFSRGNVIKYVLRAGRKAGEDAQNDLKKALFYIQRELDEGEPEKAPEAESIAEKAPEAESIDPFDNHSEPKCSECSSILQSCWLWPYTGGSGLIDGWWCVECGIFRS